MKKNLAMLSFITVFFIGLASMGISYANDNVIFFTGCGYEDNDDTTKNVGSVYAVIDGTETLLTITISNAYPGYIACVNFTAKNKGSSADDPIMYLKSRPITNTSEIGVELTDFFTGLPIPINYALNPGESLEGLLTITVKDEAEELKTYEFDVGLTFSDEPP